MKEPGVKLLAPIKVFLFTVQNSAYLFGSPPLFSFIDSFCTGKRCVCHLCRSFFGVPIWWHTRTQKLFCFFPFYVVDLNWCMCPRPTSLVFLRVIIFPFGPTDLEELSISRALYIWNKSVERSQNGWLRAGWGWSFLYAGLYILMNINISILEVPPVLLSEL